MRPLIACKDCKHYDDDWGSSCFRPELMTPHVIYGQVPQMPQVNREDENLCGIGARYFEMRRHWWEIFLG